VINSLSEAFLALELIQFFSIASSSFLSVVFVHALAPRGLQAVAKTLELVKPLHLRPDAHEVPFDVRFFLASHRKPPEAQPFLHDPEKGVNGFLPQFLEGLADRPFKPMGHNFGDTCSG